MDEVKVTEVGNAKVRLDITVPAEDVDEALVQAELVVKGLKQRPLGKKQLGADPEETTKNAIMNRATRSVVERSIHRAVDENGIRLTRNPKLNLDLVVEKSEPFSFSVVLDTVPCYQLADYRGLVVHVEDNREVTREDIDRRLEEIRGRSADVEKDSDKPISDGDIVELSFTSYLDGQPYQGNSAHGYTYSLGSGHLPEGFEDGLKGMRAGDEKSIEFSVPDDYPNGTIAGHKARFDVSVDRVASCTFPDVDDAFARSFGYEDLAAWREKIAGELALQKEEQYEVDRERAAREVLASRLLGEVDGVLVDSHAAGLMHAFKEDLKNQGTSFEEYCKFLGLTEEDIISEMREESAAMLRENLALESLFRAQGMHIAADDLETTVSIMAEENGMFQAVSFNQFNNEQQSAIREMTMHRMATDWLIRNASFV